MSIQQDDALRQQWLAAYLEIAQLERDFEQARVRAARARQGLAQAEQVQRSNEETLALLRRIGAARKDRS